MRILLKCLAIGGSRSLHKYKFIILLKFLWEFYVFKACSYQVWLLKCLNYFFLKIHKKKIKEKEKIKKIIHINIFSPFSYIIPCLLSLGFLCLKPFNTKYDVNTCNFFFVCRMIKCALGSINSHQATDCIAMPLQCGGRIFKDKHPSLTCYTCFFHTKDSDLL